MIYTDKRCVICNKPFLARADNARGKSKPGVRSKHSKTCSKDCSKKWIERYSEIIKTRNRINKARLNHSHASGGRR